MLYSIQNNTLWDAPKLKKPTIIFVDAGFSYIKNLNKEIKEGIIAYKIGKNKIQEKIIKVPDIKGLKQFTNLFELLAIKTALKKTKAKNVLVYTDSQIAKTWVLRYRNDLMQFSNQHFQVKQEIDELKKKFNSFQIEWTPRDNNIAGQYLDEKKSGSKKFFLFPAIN